MMSTREWIVFFGFILTLLGYFVYELGLAEDEFTHSKTQRWGFRLSLLGLGIEVVAGLDWLYANYMYLVKTFLL
jgi:H+/Cl- antiporter ClcA